ncbi:MAG: hypothetical protein SVR08_16340, partial [Spirochaetota bacterium]|nr:hypothetical protein [Spirochaetota bacterium]
MEIECTLSLLKELSAHDKQETIKDDRIIKETILKLNVDGAGISTDQKIDYDEKYYLYFKLLEFNIKAKCS